MTEFENVDPDLMFKKLHDRCKIFKGYYTPELVADADPLKVCYVFGDNLVRKGCGGQAVIRPYPASCGIATKRRPGIDRFDYFDDMSIADMRAIDHDIRNLMFRMLKTPDMIVYFPEHGLGTGLSDMPNRCPHLFEYLNQSIKRIFGVDYGSSSN